MWCFYCLCFYCLSLTLLSLLCSLVTVILECLLIERLSRLVGGEVECGGNGQTSRPVVEKVGLSWNKMHRCQLMMCRWGKKVDGYGPMDLPIQVSIVGEAQKLANIGIPLTVSLETHREWLRCLIIHIRITIGRT